MQRMMVYMNCSEIFRMWLTSTPNFCVTSFTMVHAVHLCTSCLRVGGETAGLLNPNGFQQNILAWKLLNGVVHITVAPFHKLFERGVEKCPWLTTCSELQQNIASV